MRLVFLFLITTLQIWAARSEYETKKNIPYREDSKALDEYQRKRCLLDIHHPSSNGFATVIWFHGGGLTSGEKSFPKDLQNKGHAIVAVNYRLSPKVKVTESLDDAAAAVAWVVNNIGELGGDKKLIFISGHSAGGYLTSMIGLDPSWLKRYKVDTNDIAGLIPYSGHAITHFTVRKERGIAATRPIVDELAPLFHVRKEAPPILLITGDRDKELLGRYEENAYLFRMLKVAGHRDVTLLELDGYGHGMTNPAHPLLLNFVKRIGSMKR